MPRSTRWAVAAVLVLLAMGILVSVGGLWRWFYYDLRGYSIGQPERTWPVSHQVGSSGLRVVAVGDPGTGDANEYAVTRAIADEHEIRRYDALLLLGDLVYPHGDADRLDEAILDPFEPLLAPSVELLPALGNHDYDSGDAEEIMQGLGRDGSWYSERVGDVLFLVLDSNQVSDPAQTAWLERVLRSSQARWTIVITHHPPYSAGPEGSDADVRDAWTPLFSEYGVELALAGHDHDYQRSESIDGVVYVVSGAGAKTHPTGSDDFTEFSAGQTLQFLDLQITDQRLLGQAIDTNGRAFDKFTLRPRP